MAGDRFEQRIERFHFESEPKENVPTLFSSLSARNKFKQQTRELRHLVLCLSNMMELLYRTASRDSCCHSITLLCSVCHCEQTYFTMFALCLYALYAQFFFLFSFILLCYYACSPSATKWLCMQIPFGNNVSTHKHTDTHPTTPPQPTKEATLRFSLDFALFPNTPSLKQREKHNSLSSAVQVEWLSCCVKSCPCQITRK